MKEVSRLYEEEEYFRPEVLMCSDAFNSGLDVVNPHLDKKLPAISKALGTTITRYSLWG